MSTGKITRRRLLTGASGLVLASYLPNSASARPRFLRGGKGSDVAIGSLNGASALAFSANANSIPPTSDGRSMTFVNTSASPTPADVPILAQMWFPPGAVPSGSIAVPQVGGLDQKYNLANRAPDWGDGSLRGGGYYISLSSSIPAGATRQITFDVRSGSYSNTSSVTIDTVTSETDFNVQLSNCHTVKVAPLFDYTIPTEPVSVSAEYSVTLSGGQISGVKVWYIHSNATMTATITQPGGGSGGEISFTNKVPTITNPGSGYTLLGGTGLVSISLNDIIAGIAADGNRVNGRRIERYASGDGCDAWIVYYAVPNVPHFWVIFFIERWKKADGSLLDYKAYVEFGVGLMDSVNIARNLTFDLDFRNGTTVIVGANGGDARFQTTTNYVVMSAKTLTTVGKPPWLNNHAAFTAIELQRTQVEAMYYRSTGMSFPVLKTIVPEELPPTIESAFDYGLGPDGISRLLTYQPFANGGIRVPLNDPGGFYGEPSIHPVQSLIWINWYNGNTTDAGKWVRNQRVAAANSTCMPILGTGIYEPTTMFLPNNIPIATQGFTGMVPSRYLTAAYDFMALNTTYGVTDPIQIIGNSVFHDNSHAVNFTYGAYILEGEMHQLLAVLNASVAGMSGRGPYGRSQKIGTQEYHGYAFASAGYNIRIPYRKARSDMYAAAVAPLTWADGSARPETEMIRFYMEGAFAFLNAIIPYVGTVMRGISDGYLHDKLYDLTGTGLTPEATMIMEYGENIEQSTFFMEYYGFEAVVHGAWLHQDTNMGDLIAAWRDHHATAMIGNYSYSGPHYLSTTFRRRNMNGPFPSTPIVMSNGFSVSSPSIAAAVQTVTGVQPSIGFTSGSSDITITGNGVWVRPGVTMADGSRIFLTTSNINLVTQNAYSAPPSPYNMTTAYYWLQGANPAVGKLCTGLDGNGDPDPATAAVASATVTAVGFTAVFNDVPADNSGLVVIDTYYPEYCGAIKAAKAFGLPAMGGMRDAAIANLNIIGTSSGMDWNASVKYGHDDNLS